MNRMWTTPAVDKKLRAKAQLASFGGWLLVCVIAGFGTVSMLQTVLGIGAQYLTVPYRIAILVLSAVIILLSASSKLKNRIYITLLIFFFVYLIRLIYDAFIAEIDGADEAIMYFVSIVAIPTVAASISGVFILDDGLTAKRLLILGAFFLALVQTGIRLNVVSENWWWNAAGEGRLGFDSLNPIAIGNLCASIVLASVIIVLESRAGLLWRIVAVAVAGVGGSTLLAAGSRGPLIGLALAIAWFGLSRIRRFAFVLPLIFVALFAGLSSEAVVQRTLDTIDRGYNVDRSAMERLTAQSLAIEDFLSSPLIGRYYIHPNLGRGLYPHNIIIETAMALGIVGLALLFIVILRGALKVLRYFSFEHPLLTMLLVQYTVEAMVSGALWGSDNFFVLLGVLLSSRSIKARIWDRDLRLTHGVRFAPAAIRPLGDQRMVPLQQYQLTR